MKDRFMRREVGGFQLLSSNVRGEGYEQHKL
jgi:hypothetical protein